MNCKKSFNGDLNHIKYLILGHLFKNVIKLYIILSIIVSRFLEIFN